MTRAILLLLVVGLLLAPTASAAPPRLDLDRADRAATHEADFVVNAWADWYDASIPVGEYVLTDEFGQPLVDEETGEVLTDYNVAISGYTLDTCDHVSAHKAECEITYALNDGDSCDSTIKVRTTRRDRLRVRSDDLLCDSGASS